MEPPLPSIGDIHLYCHFARAVLPREIPRLSGRASRSQAASHVDQLALRSVAHFELAAAARVLGAPTEAAAMVVGAIKLLQEPAGEALITRWIVSKQITGCVFLRSIAARSRFGLLRLLRPLALEAKATAEMPLIVRVLEAARGGAPDAMRGRALDAARALSARQARVATVSQMLLACALFETSRAP